MDISKKLLSVNEAATTLGLGRSLVYTLILNGEINSIKIGRARRIPPSAIDESRARRLQHEICSTQIR